MKPDPRLTVRAAELLRASKELLAFLEEDSLEDQKTDPRLRLERVQATARLSAVIAWIERRKA